MPSCGIVCGNNEDVFADGEEFEYIVVGAGAAGSAAAARLAQRGARVLLVEAGGDPGPLTTVSTLSIYMLILNKLTYFVRASFLPYYPPLSKTAVLR